LQLSLFNGWHKKEQKFSKRQTVRRGGGSRRSESLFEARGEGVEDDRRQCIQAHGSGKFALPKLWTINAETTVLP
jgi:hypothetical protein